MQLQLLDIVKEYSLSYCIRAGPNPDGIPYMIITLGNDFSDVMKIFLPFAVRDKFFPGIPVTEQPLIATMEFFAAGKANISFPLLNWPRIQCEQCSSLSELLQAIQSRKVVFMKGLEVEYFSRQFQNMYPFKELIPYALCLDSSGHTIHGVDVKKTRSNYATTFFHFLEYPLSGTVSVPDPLRDMTIDKLAIIAKFFQLDPKSIPPEEQIYLKNHRCIRSYKKVIEHFLKGKFRNLSNLPNIKIDGLPLLLESGSGNFERKKYVSGNSKILSLFLGAAVKFHCVLCNFSTNSQVKVNEHLVLFHFQGRLEKMLRNASRACPIPGCSMAIWPQSVESRMFHLGIRHDFVKKFLSDLLKQLGSYRPEMKCPVDSCLARNNNFTIDKYVELTLSVCFLSSIFLFIGCCIMLSTTITILSMEP